MKIIKAVQTCWACPSQWDAWTDNNKYLYLRYRSGHGTVKKFESEAQSNKDFWSGELIAEFTYGNSLDGSIDLESFCKLANIELDI